MIDIADGCLRIHQRGGGTGCLAVFLITLGLCISLFVLVFTPALYTS